MNEIHQFLGEIDSIRFRRAKELSEIKVRMSDLVAVSHFGLKSKTVIVLSYAHWEGFYNDCVSLYVEFLKKVGKKVSEVSWPMLIGLLQPDLQRLKDRNHSHRAAVDFALRLQQAIQDDFSDFNREVVSSRSNLNFKKLRANFDVLGFDCSPLLRWRLKIDNELVRWRHSVAHGDEPDLSSVDIEDHVAFTQKMLLVLSDLFQHEMLRIAEQGG